MVGRFGIQAAASPANAFCGTSVPVTTLPAPKSGATTVQQCVSTVVGTSLQKGMLVPLTLASACLLVKDAANFASQHTPGGGHDILIAGGLTAVLGAGWYTMNRIARPAREWLRTNAGNVSEQIGALAKSTTLAIATGFTALGGWDVLAARGGDTYTHSTLGVATFVGAMAALVGSTVIAIGNSQRMEKLGKQAAA